MRKKDKAANRGILWKYWQRTYETLGVSRANMLAVFQSIIGMYEEVGRIYHTTDHLVRCLREFDEVRDLTNDPAAVELAIYFHDAVYDPSREDNEEESARLFEYVASDLRLDAHKIATVTGFILATKTHRDVFAAHPDFGLFIDIDLSSLGASPDVFDRDVRNIREEYKQYTDEEFSFGRARWAHTMLDDRPSIYLTKYFQDKYEVRAQANLKESLVRLEQGRL